LKPKTPLLVWQLYYEGRDGQPRPARTRAEHKELDRIIDARCKDDLFALQWIRYLIGNFQATLKEDPTHRALKVVPLLLKNARQVESAIVNGQPFLRDLVELMQYQSEYRAGLVIAARLTAKRAVVERKKAKDEMRIRERRNQLLAIWAEKNLTATTKRDAAYKLNKHVPDVSLRTIQRDLKILPIPT